MTKGTVPSGMGHSSQKVLRPAQVLAECEGNTEWIVEKDSYKYQLTPQDQFEEVKIIIYISVSIVFC